VAGYLGKKAKNKNKRKYNRNNMKLNLSGLSPRLRRQLQAKGFTLVELLVVVAILAIIGGGLIAAYDGLTSQAAKSSATHTLGAIDTAVRSFNTLEKKLPNNVESLLAGTPDTPVHNPALADSIAEGLTAAPAEPSVSPGPGLDAFIGSSLAPKIAPATLTPTQLNNLRAAGVTLVRYLDTAGVDETVDALSITDALGGAAPVVGAFSAIDIPTQAFSAPRPGANRNRGRGFAVDLAGTTFDATNMQFAVWGGQNPSAPTPNYDNVKVGANATAVLVALGIGPDSSIVNSNSDTTGGVGNARLANAPIYGDVLKNQYQHYIMLVDVSQNPARYVACVDSRGDFLDEEYAEASGQKQ
jgi:prepilin-type N-terminal cleavage/methylation domain-containing protein